MTNPVLFRWYANLLPAYRGTGGRITYIATDWREARVRLALNWRTRNYVGTIFGGSLYAAADPIYMVMLIQILGPGYIVWDKAASIRFRKPGRGVLQATFRIEAAETDRIRRELEGRESLDVVYPVEWVDREGTVFARLEKTIYIKRKA